MYLFWIMHPLLDSWTISLMITNRYRGCSKTCIEYYHWRYPWFPQKNSSTTTPAQTLIFPVLSNGRWHQFHSMVFGGGWGNTMHKKQYWKDSSLSENAVFRITFQNIHEEKTYFGSWEVTGPFAKNPWSKDDTSLIFRQKKKKIWRNLSALQTTIFSSKFFWWQRFLPDFFFLNWANIESITNHITEQWKRFLNALIIDLKGSNPLQKNLSSIKMLHFNHSSVSLKHHLLLFILPFTLFNISPFLNISNTLCVFAPLLLLKSSFPYSKFNTDIIQINSC